MEKSKQLTSQTDSRCTKSEFRDLIYTICDEIPGDNTFEFFIDFVESCVEVSYSCFSGFFSGTTHSAVANMIFYRPPTVE